MSFYLTLPSYSSIDHFPNNTLTHYFTKLKRTIKLDGEYEVGLAEIMYPLNWKKKRDGIMTFKYEKKIDNKVDTKLESFKVTFALYDTIHDLFKDINDFALKRNIPFNIRYHNNKVVITVKLWTVEFIGGLNEELGYKYTKIQAGNNDTIFEAQKEVENNIYIINSLYIYTDIIEFQFVGDSFAPLLRAVGVDSRNKQEQYIDEVFTNPHYIPVSRNSIDTIEIQIRDDQGNKINFNPGKVLVKLHFRPKTYYGL